MTQVEVWSMEDRCVIAKGRRGVRYVIGERERQSGGHMSSGGEGGKRFKKGGGHAKPPISDHSPH
jgi:hypothetical protein